MVSYYHQVFSLTHSPTHVIPVNTSMVSYYHQVFSLTLTHSLSHPCHPCEHSHGVVLPPSLPTHCSERVSVPTHTPMVSYYHQVSSLTALRELVLPFTLPWCRTTTKCTHSLSHSLLSHSHFHGVVLPPSLPTHCSERTCVPTHTSMVSYYHQVYPLTALRECLFPLTLPWCRTTTKSIHSLL